MKEHLAHIDDFLTKGEIKKAEVLIAKLLRSQRHDIDQSTLLFRRARTRLLSGRPEDAINDLMNIRDIAPETFRTAPILELLGDSYFARFELASVGFSDRNDTLLAQHTYEDIIRDHTRYNNLGWVCYQLGRIFVTLSKIDEAEKCFERALIAPSHVSVLTAYCYERLAFIAFYERRDLDQALAFLNRAIDTYPATAERNWLTQVHILRSRVLRGMGDYSSALQAAETALSIIASSSGNKKSLLSEALLTNAELLAEMGGHDKEVVESLQAFLQNARKPLGIDVTWSRVNEMLANAYFNLGSYESAIAAFKAALRLNPDHPWSVSLYYSIARSYYQQRAFEEAISAVNQVLAVAEAEGQIINDYRVYDILGNAHFALGRYEQAIEAYNTALQMAPANANNIDKIKSYYDLARERVR
jgi:tetratricopeptide (TPR) repeat protein